ncbi:MAG: two-component regulator propeller domain-containing protein [Bacteroidota bacterium]
MGRTLRYTLLLVALSFNVFSHAQSARFRRLMVDDGLPQNTVACVAQDSMGFMWIGTADGLARYDGLSFKIYKYDPFDTNSLSANSVRSLLYHKNVLWIGTGGGGMDKFDLKTGKITRFVHDKKNEKSIPGDFINKIVLYDDKLYLATSDAGLCVFDLKTENFSRMKSVSGTNIRDLCIDKNGVFWIAGWGGGLTAYDPKEDKYEYYHADGTERSLLTEKVRAVYADSRGWIWVSQWNQGYNVIEPSTGKVYSSRDSTSVFCKTLRYGLISSFFEDSQGYMWLATAEHGAVRYDMNTGEAREFMTDASDLYSISDNTVFCVYEDKSGILWFGTWRGGVSIHDPKTYRFGWYKKDPGDSASLCNNNVYDFLLSSSGEIYMGTSEGVCIFNPLSKKFRKLDYVPDEKNALRPNSIVHSICEDSGGVFWFGTNGGGLYRLDPVTRKFRNYYYTGQPNSLSSASPSVMVFDNARNLLIGTYGGGVCRYNRDKDDFKVYYPDTSDASSIRGATVSAMVRDVDGKIWIGTADGCLNLFDPLTEKFTHFQNDPKDSASLIENSISNLFLDSKNRLWVGTAAGLCMYDKQKKKFINYSRLHPFLKQEIAFIIEDQQGYIWTATNRGLARLNTRSGQVKLYDVNDGLQSNEFLYKAAMMTPDGKLYLGGFHGFNAFNPFEIKDNTVAPYAAITGFTVLNKKYNLPLDISFTKEIVLDYSDYFFSFEFSALEYSNPKKNQYRYKLEGFNSEWVDNGNNNKVTFTNLDPGEYVLKVLAANNSGVWSEVPTEIRIIITPPFWRTKWFYFLCAATLLLLAYSYIKWREQKLVREKAVLEKAVHDRTLELRHEKEKVEEAHKSITDSINYARKIQTAILPQDGEFWACFPNSFVLFKPKDIVSGDFYWVTSSGDHLFYATCDCTGHGVPGGFMTMLGTSLLNEIVNEKNIIEPAEILNTLRDRIILSLKQSSAGESKDGMDMSVCRMDKKRAKLVYAGANNALYLVRAGALEEYKPDKQPVGFYEDVKRPFTQKEIALQKGDVIYTFSDGYADQFGGDKGKKFKYRNFEQLLVAIHDKPMKEQKKILDETIEDWRGDFEQLDDILVIGIRI